MKRKEDPALLRGEAQFVDDIHRDGMLFCAFVRSPYAKARVVRINRPHDARLVDFLTEKELSGQAKPFANFEMDGKKFASHALPSKVHFFGEPVAAVLASSRYDAEDLVDLVEVEYAQQEPVTRSDDALTNPKTLAIDEWSDNIAFRKTVSKGNFGSTLDLGSAIEMTIKLARQAAVPIETRGVVASYDKISEQLEVHYPSKGYHTTRSLLSSSLGIPEESIRVIVPDMGGAFGVKGYLFAEELVCSLFSIRTGKPVKWISTRTEDFLTTIQGRDEIHKATIVVNKELKIVGFRDELIVDVGTPGRMSFSGVSRMIPLLTGCYDIPNVQLNYTGIVTNKPPMGPIRGNGRPEAILVIERAIENASLTLNIDSVLLRQRNLIPPNSMPFDNKIGSTYDSGNYPEALEKTVNYLKLTELRRRQREERTRGNLIGIGMACYVEDTGTPGFETASIRVEKNGTLLATSGSSPHGQGHETTFAEIISEELGEFDIDKIKVIFGDTSEIPKGTGTFGSRSTAIAGSAIVLAAREIKERLIKFGAESFFKCEPRQIVFKTGTFESPDGRKISVQDLIARWNATNKAEPMVANVKYNAEHIAYSNGVVCALVHVDRDSGLARVNRLIALDDCGRVIDHDLVDDQIFGGVAHGLSNAIFEAIEFSDEGVILNSNLMDYEIPSANEVPDIEALHMETYSTTNLLGSKGAGEGGTVGGLGAIFNAVCDALQSELENVPVNSSEVLIKLKKT